MDVQTVNFLSGYTLKCWESLLKESELTPEEPPESTVLVWDNGELVATGSRNGSLFKYIAVSKNHQGEDLTATVITNLRQDAFKSGYKHLFLYTKPKNRLTFGSLFFYPIAETETVLLMESEQNGIREFLNGFPDNNTEAAACVMNCSPFTCGHRFLVETAAKECEKVFVFVLSEENGPFSAEDRLQMVKNGLCDLKNVTVLPSGPYLISSATFPTYFLKERDAATDVHCKLDIEIFAKYYAPKFNIKTRLVGEEPFSAATDKYNDCLKERLPQKGIAVKIIPRLKYGDTAISATKVREYITSGKSEEIKNLVPETTYKYLKDKNYI